MTGATVEETAERIAEADRRTPEERAARQAMQLLMGIVQQLPRADNLLLRDEALDAMLVLQQHALSDFGFVRAIVREKCGEAILRVFDKALLQRGRQPGGQQSSTPRRNLLDLSAMSRTSPPPMEWLRHLWLSWNLTLLAAMGGMGKTLLLLMLAVALASGRDFMGQGGERRRVLVWLCEDDEAEIHRRLAAICRFLQVDLADLDGWLVIDARVGLENELITTEFGRPMWTPLVEELREQVNDYAADVLMLDNIAQVYGAGQNVPHDVTMFVNGISGLVRGRRFAPILTGHTARSQGSEFAGSAAWENAVRMRWYLGDRLPDEKIDDDEPIADGVRYLCRRKSNYSAKDYIRMTFQNGVLVPEDVQDEAGGVVGEIRRRKARSVILEGLRALQGMGKNASESNGVNYLPRLILQFNLAAGLTKRELEDGMRQLMTSGNLKRAEVGTYGNRTPRFGLVEVTE